MLTIFLELDFPKDIIIKLIETSTKATKANKVKIGNAILSMDEIDSPYIWKKVKRRYVKIAKIIAFEIKSEYFFSLKIKTPFLKINDY